MKTFESWLEERFIDTLEVDGVPIIKDNCEDMFSTYLENLDGNEMMDLYMDLEQISYNFHLKSLKSSATFTRILNCYPPPLKSR